MDGPGHLLSLKVMRVSRPALATAWQPFYSSSPSFSAHSTASILSLQGKSPLPGHPKTLRDLTHATELLTLPSTFGTIQLGEIFSCCLCINNETTSFVVEGVTIKVEMQTVTTKVTLAEFGGSDFRLAVGDSLEDVISHEIKELGQHVLACTVAYRLPPNARHAPGPADDATDQSLQTFRKFYKFAVSNPLSVKTKVHSPKSPSALMSATERQKIFLEVHIQNLTQEAMWFERMSFQCIEGWKVIDTNLDDEKEESMFSGSMAIMQPQDMRQYIYILSPTSIPSFPVVHPPGSIIPLGRLDISWRSSFGEPGRLLTSMLSRKIALPPAPVQQPASALPLYLQRTPAVPSASPSRPRSPQLVQSRPGTPPPQRPGSPFRSRSVVGTSTPSTPANAPVPLVVPLPAPRTHEIGVDVVILHIPRDSIVVEKPFTVSFRLTVSAPWYPSDQHDKLPGARIISLAVQHIQASRAITPVPATPASVPDVSSNSHPPSGQSSPSPTGTPWRGAFNYGVTHDKLLAASPTHHENDEGINDPGDVVLPPPFATRVTDRKNGVSSGVTFIGSSALCLPPLRLSAPGLLEKRNDDIMTSEAAQDFELSFLPLRQGLVEMSGLRVLLIEDKTVYDNDSKLSNRRDVRTLREWEVLGEIWVEL